MPGADVTNVNSSGMTGSRNEKPRREVGLSREHSLQMTRLRVSQMVAEARQTGRPDFQLPA